MFNIFFALFAPRNKNICLVQPERETPNQFVKQEPFWSLNIGICGEEGQPPGHDLGIFEATVL